MPLVSAGRVVWANVLKCCESLVNAIVRRIATEVPASIFFKSIHLSRIANSRDWEVKALPTEVAGRTAHRQGKPMQHAKRPAFSSGPKSQTVRLSPFPRGRARRRWAAPDSSRGSDRTKSLPPNQLQRI